MYTHLQSDLESQIEENELRREDKYYTMVCWLSLGVAVILVGALFIINILR